MSVTSLEFLGKILNNKIKADGEFPDLKEISDTLYDLSEAKEVLNFFDMDNLKFLAEKFSMKFDEKIYEEHASCYKLESEDKDDEEDEEETEEEKDVNEMTKEELIEYIYRLVKIQQYYVDFNINTPEHAREMIRFCSKKCFFEISFFKPEDINNFQNKALNNSPELNNKKLLTISGDFKTYLEDISNNDRNLVLEDFVLTFKKTCSNDEFLRIFFFIIQNEDILYNFFNKTFIRDFKFHEKIIEILDDYFIDIEYCSKITKGIAIKDIKNITKKLGDLYETY